MNEQVRNQRIVKTLSILAFCSITLALIVIARAPSSNGYEMSIYDAYPFYFWLLIIISIIIGQLVLLSQVIFHFESKYWIFGYAAILTADIVLLLIPLIRGYVTFGSGDVLSHIGFMNAIFSSGHVNAGDYQQDMYPIEHILGVTISLFSGIKIISLPLIVPAIFTMFYAVSFYILAKQLFKRQGEVLLTLLFASVLLFGAFNVLFVPNGQSLMLIPFFLYLFFRSSRFDHRREFTSLAIITLFSIVFFHPFTTLAIIGTILIAGVSYSITSKKKGNFLPFNARINFNLLLIALITFFAWQAYASLVVQSLQYAYGALLGTQATTLGGVTNTFSYGQPSFIDVIRVLLNIYGQYIIIGLLSLFCIFNLFIMMKRNRFIPEFPQLFASLGFVLFSVFAALLFFSFQVEDFLRPYFFALVFSTILIPSLVYPVLRANENKNRTVNVSKIVRPTLICLLLVSILYFSVFNLYLSPISLAANQQVSSAELTGMTTFFKVNDQKTQAVELGLYQFRFYDAIVGRYVEHTNTSWLMYWG